MTGATGVYGGTFNPIHLGHLRAAEEVVEALGLERMLFVPCAQPPHKPASSLVIASATERLAWLRLAVAENPRFEVDSLEIDRDGPSYSVDTLRQLGRRLAPALPVFTIGRDAFVEMNTWREPEAIFTLAHIAVTTRPTISSSEDSSARSAPGESLADWLPECVRSDIEMAADGRSGRHRRAGTWIRLVEVTDLDISASDIRSRILNGTSTRYLMPEVVRAAVESSGAYAHDIESGPNQGRTGGRVEQTA